MPLFTYPRRVSLAGGLDSAVVVDGLVEAVRGPVGLHALVLVLGGSDVIAVVHLIILQYRLDWGPRRRSQYNLLLKWGKKSSLNSTISYSVNCCTASNPFKINVFQTQT